MKNGPIWVGDHIQKGENTPLLGSADGLSVAVSQITMWSQYPEYHLLRLHQGGRLSHLKLSAPYTQVIIDPLRGWSMGFSQK